MASIDLSGVPNDFFGKVTAVAAIMTYNATDSFTKKVDEVLAKSNTSQEGAGAGLQTPSDPTTSGNSSTTTTTGTGGTNEAASEMADNLVLMAASQRVTFVTNMAASIVNKSAEAKSNVAKAG